MDEADPFFSHWSVDDLVAQLSEFQRVDDARDQLACYLAGDSPSRFVYVYTYGEDPRVIYYDLEDESAGTQEWDRAVERGEARSVEELRAVCRRFLGGV